MKNLYKNKNGQNFVKNKIRTVTQIITFVIISVVLFISTIVAEKINVSAEIKNLKSKDMNKKLTAIYKLGKANDRRATSELIKELKTQRKQNWYIRSKIIEAIGNTKDDLAVDEIESVLKSEEEDISLKSIAIISLAKIATEKAITILIDIFNNEKEEISLRLEALEGLSRIKDEKITFDILVKATDDTNPIIRKTAVGLLWHNFYSTKKEQITSILKKMLNDNNKEVAESVKQMLEF